MPQFKNRPRGSGFWPNKNNGNNGHSVSNPSSTSMDFWEMHKRKQFENAERENPKPVYTHTITVEEAARQLGVCRQTIRRYIQTGRLIAWDVGAFYRIPVMEWENFLQKCLTIEEPVLWLTPKDVMDILRIGEWKFNDIIKSGELPSYRVGRSIRVRRDELEAWMESKRVQV